MLILCQCGCDFRRTQPRSQCKTQGPPLCELKLSPGKGTATCIMEQQTFTAFRMPLGKLQMTVLGEICRIYKWDLPLTCATSPPTRFQQLKAARCTAGDVPPRSIKATARGATCHSDPIALPARFIDMKVIHTRITPNLIVLA